MNFRLSRLESCRLLNHLKPYTLVALACAVFLPAIQAHAQVAATAAVEAAPAADPAPAPRKFTPIHDLQVGSNFGIGFRVSSLGLGGEIAARVAKRANVRGGVNAIFTSVGYDHHGIHYSGDLKWTSAEAHLDLFPLGHSFHLSPGMIVYNDNRVLATASVPGGNDFTLGGTAFENDPSNPLTGSGKLSFRKVAPTFMIGFGNLVPRNGKHFSFNIEAGVAFTGSPRVALNLAGSACDTSGLNCRDVATDPTIQSQVQAEQTRISDNLTVFKFYPLAAMTLGFHF